VSLGPTLIPLPLETDFKAKLSVKPVPMANFAHQLQKQQLLRPARAVHTARQGLTIVRSMCALLARSLLKATASRLLLSARIALLVLTARKVLKLILYALLMPSVPLALSFSKIAPRIPTEDPLEANHNPIALHAHPTTYAPEAPIHSNAQPARMEYGRRKILMRDSWFASPQMSGNILLALPLVSRHAPLVNIVLLMPPSVMTVLRAFIVLMMPKMFVLMLPIVPRAPPHLRHVQLVPIASQRKKRTV